MYKKLLIVPYFGELPEWFDAWRTSIAGIKQYGYDLLFIPDLAEFERRAKLMLGIDLSIKAGTGKIWDLRAALGYIYQRELDEGGYDFWGHTDLDVVYGNISNFMPDELLDTIDIISDEKDYIGGHWTLYRNCAAVNKLFLLYPGWSRFMVGEKPNGWVEKEFTKHAEASDLRIKYKLVQASRDNQGLELRNGCLYQHGKEVMLAHFKDQKRWPL